MEQPRRWQDSAGEGTGGTEDQMILLIWAIFLASVLGSFHCAGMCGAFLAIAIGEPKSSWRRQTALQGAYHLGRLISYAALGAAAGAAGSLLNIAGALGGIRPIAITLAGAAMVLFGIVTILRSAGVAIGRFHLPSAWTRLMQRGHRAAMDRPPIARSLSIGLLTTLLPCGWLYAFAVTAAGTGSPVRGAVAMVAFWAGTLPMLVTMGAGLRRLLGPLGQKLPVFTAILVVAAGLYTLSGRMRLDPMALGAQVGRDSSRRSSSLCDNKIPTAGSTACCSNEEERRDKSRPTK